MKGLRRYIVLLFSFLAAWAGMVSCAEKKPEGVLSKAEMVKIMEEMYLAEEKINHMALSRDSSKKVFTVMGAKVFERATVSDTVFRRSFDYYMEHPRQMELIYTALVDTLHLREQRAPFRPDQQ